MPYTPRKAYVVGVGLTKFDKPRGERDYPELGLEATVKVRGINVENEDQPGLILTTSSLL